MASLLARESIQNSWDAALERQEFCGDAKKIGFHLEFKFVELKGKAKQQFVKAAGLDELADHMQNITDCSSDEIVANPETLNEATNNSEPLRLLYLIERGTTGMYGGWGSTKSKMHLALANFGYTEKPIAGSGGTKGYGKTALARNSGTRTVICYSAFNPSIAPIHPDASHDDGHTTRRIFGMGYWKKHNHRDGLSLNGWHRFGYSKTDESETNEPAVDAEADTLAKALGMPIRDAQKAEDIGSTFMIIDPIMDADSLVDAVRRWWWPAIVDRKTDFDVTVTDFDGRELKPNPSDDPELEEFVRAYRLKEDLNPKTEHKVFFQEITVKMPNEALKVNPGVLHLVADPSENGWTNPYDSSIDLNSDEGISVPHASIIALIRKTKMVVRYSVVAKAKPFIRGVFVSDPSDANELLAWTEDALHSNWEHEADEDRKGKTYCFDFAKTVLVRIASNTNAFRDKFRQAGVSSTEVTLNEFDRIMNPLRGRKKTKARKDPKEVSKGPPDITYPETRTSRV